MTQSKFQLKWKCYFNIRTKLEIHFGDALSINCSWYEKINKAGFNCG